jgi:hypothetical protein
MTVKMEKTEKITEAGLSPSGGRAVNFCCFKSRRDDNCITAGVAKRNLWL